MGKITAAITAIGGYVPEKKLTNFDLEKMVDTSDEWIISRTGVKERRILDIPGLATSDMAMQKMPGVLTLLLLAVVSCTHWRLVQNTLSLANTKKL